MRNPYLSLLRTSWRYAGNEKPRYLFIYAMFTVANLILASNPLLYGWFLNTLQKDGAQALKYAWIYGAAYMGLKLIEWIFHGPARVMERKLAFNIGKRYLQEHYNKVLHLPIQWHQDHHSGATINRLRKGYESLRDFFQTGFVILHVMAKFVCSFVAMLYFSPLFGSIAILLGIFTVYVIVQFDKPYVRLLKKMNEKENDVSSNLFDSLSNIISVITLRLEKRIEKTFMRKVKHVFPVFYKISKVSELKWFTAQMLIGLIYTVVIIGYVYQNWSPGKIFMIGGLVTLLGYINQFTSVFNDIAAQYTKILQYDTDVRTATDLIGKAYAENKKPEAFVKIPDNWESIDLSNLHFRRMDSENIVAARGGLYGLEIRIKRGEKVALIGESGSGKSTLLALMRGLYAPKAGSQIQLDGHQAISYEALADTVTLFPQEPEIFENTILYNITLGLPFSDEEVKEVCDIAKFSEVLKNLPNGLNSHIQEKGVNLSGGQKQRLALARGLLAAKTSKVVLLDEPTSSVDPRTEAQIYEKMFMHFEDKAFVSSLHRLHLLTRFDYIYILDQGKVVDEGTFSELKLRSDIFKELWKHQEEFSKSILPAVEIKKVS